MKLLLNILLQGFFLTTFAQQTPCYLHRSVDLEGQVTDKESLYTPLFGEGDADANIVQGINRFGILTLGPNAKNKVMDFGREEVVYYVLRGAGSLLYDNQKASIVVDDFFYVPANTPHQFTTDGQWLKLIVMGYGIPEETSLEPSKVQIANAGQVEFQTLEQLNHGATSRFQLLLGTTESKRDRLAVANQVNSLFVIDFDPEGTNVPHKHPKEEEIYLVLQGQGEMVAGETEEASPNKITTKAGDAFYYSKNCLVGFYSDTKEGVPHSRILAIRSK